jgi:hypothetical protein
MGDRHEKSLGEIFKISMRISIIVFMDKQHDNIKMIFMINIYDNLYKQSVVYTGPKANTNKQIYVVSQNQVHP